MGVSTISKELADRLRDHLFPQKEKFHSEAPTPTSLGQFIKFLHINNNNNNNSNNRVPMADCLYSMYKGYGRM